MICPYYFMQSVDKCKILLYNHAITERSGSMRKLDIDKDYLVEMYCTRGMTLLEIACDLGVSRQTVSNKLQEFGIEIKNAKYIQAHKKPPKKKLKKVCKWRDKEDFQRVYSELKSLDLVARHYGINLTTASDWKLRHGIETIKSYSYKGRKQLVVDKPYANKEWLEKMYAEYSLEDLAKMLNCSPSTLGKWCKKFGIKTRSIEEQWELKAKYGNKVVKSSEFDLQLYKKTYGVGRREKLPKTLKNFIVSLYGKCECCGYDEVLDLHHIDGDHNNNDPANHGVICPNCHAKIHRLGISFSELVPEHTVWTELLDTYQDAK